jgi:hypothetical protein
MRRLLIILSIAALGMFSCTGGEDKVQIPPDVISPDSMISIFVDFQLAEAAIQEQQQKNKDPKEYTGYYYSMILKTHHIDRHSYDHSLQFYSYHPKLLVEIYDKVLSELSTKQGRSMERLQPAEQE